MGTFHTLAGAVYMIGWFVFLDGALFAKQYGSPYVFVETLPGIFCTIGMILFAICNIKSIAGGGNDEDSWGMMGGGGGGGFGGEEDENAPMKARILFFAAAIFMLAGMTISVWQLAGNDARKEQPWTGWALLLQVFIQMIAALFLGIGQVKAEKKSDGF
jgi:hypothetical protein